MPSKDFPTIRWSNRRLKEVLKGVWKQGAQDRNVHEWDRPLPTDGLPSFHEDECESFPACCAFDVFSGLHVPFSVTFPGWSERQLYAGMALRWRMDNEGAPYGILTTGQGQENVVKMLTKLGFEKLGPAIINPNHNSRVQIWRGKKPRG